MLFFEQFDFCLSTFFLTLSKKLAVECDKFKLNPMSQSTLINHDSTGIIDTSTNVDNLYERLKNTSFDAAQQRKLNKNLP